MKTAIKVLGSLAMLSSVAGFIVSLALCDPWWTVRGIAGTIIFLAIMFLGIIWTEE